MPGEIKSLTVAAFVDLSTRRKMKLIKVKQSSESKAEAEPIMTTADVKEIIKKAVGPKLKDEDLKVVNAKFNRPDRIVNRRRRNLADLIL